MTNYRKGAGRERALAAYFADQGMHCVRAAGSHGCADLIVFDAARNTVRLIQVKSTKKGTVRAALILRFLDELHEFEEMKTPSCCQKELWICVAHHGWTSYYFARDVQGNPSWLLFAKDSVLGKSGPHNGDESHK